MPLKLYLTELKWRISYFILSFLLCLYISITYNDTVFFLETFGLTYWSKKKFIATHVTELFSTILYVGFYLTCLGNFPYAYYHLKSFIKSSWYQSQIDFFSILLIQTSFIFFFGIFLCYTFILPYTFMFLTTWEIIIIHALQIQEEIRIETYMHWTLQIVCFFSNILFLFYWRFLYSYLVDNMITLHLFLRRNKKYFFILFYFFLSAIVPPDYLLQLSLIGILLTITEFLFFITCIFFAKNNV